MKELLQDMERYAPSFVKRTKEEALGGDETEDDSGVSTTSHEFGVQWSEDEDTSGSEVEQLEEAMQKTFLTSVGEMATMTKGVKRRLKYRAKEVRDTFAVKMGTQDASKTKAEATCSTLQGARDLHVDDGSDVVGHGSWLDRM